MAKNRRNTFILKWSRKTDWWENKKPNSFFLIETNFKEMLQKTVLNSA